MNLTPSGNVIVKSRRSRLLGSLRRAVSFARRVPVLHHLYHWVWDLEFKSLLDDHDEQVGPQ